MITYLIKVLLCSGILLLVYFLFLEKEKMHRFNRFYLLFGIVFAFLVPLIVLQGEKEILPFAEPVYSVNTDVNPVYITPIPQQDSVETTPGSWLPNPLWIVYGGVSMLFLFRFSKNLFRLRNKIQRSEKARYKNAVLILIDECPVPYSFLHYIFVKKEDYQNGLIEEEILHHELVHVRQKHSWDILFAELVLCFAWFNPFLYGFKKAIQLNHEFLADDSVVKKFHNTTAYQYLLLHKATAASHSLLTSSFNYLTTKKRLIMMTKTFSPFITGLKQIMLLPLTALLIFFFSTKLEAQNTGKTEPQKKQETKVQKDTTNKPNPWIRMSIGYTKEGVSEELLQEYNNIINKYREGDSLNWKSFESIGTEDKARLETIFKQMSFEQQSKQDILFLKSFPPLAKVVPTENQFESFKNAKVYGVWINDKKVSNSELIKYKNTDFSQVHISKLYGAARKGRSYTHQVNLMTNDYYKEYYKKTKAAEEKSVMVFVQRTSKSTGTKQIN